MINTQIVGLIFFILGIWSFYTRRDEKEQIDIALSALCILISIALFFLRPS